MKTITIQLKTDFDTEGREEREKILMDAAKVAAKHLRTTAALIAGKRPPSVCLYTEDEFTSAEEIDLAEELVLDNPERTTE